MEADFDMPLFLTEQLLVRAAQDLHTTSFEQLHACAAPAHVPHMGRQRSNTATSTDTMTSTATAASSSDSSRVNSSDDTPLQAEHGSFIPAFGAYAQGDYVPETAYELPQVDATDESTMQWLLSLDDFASQGLFDAAMRDAWALDEMLALYQTPCETKREFSVMSSESWKTVAEAAETPFSVTDAYQHSVSHNKARIATSARGQRNEPYSESRAAAKRASGKNSAQQSPAARSPCTLSPNASSPSHNEILFKLCDTCHHHGIAKYCPEVSCWFRSLPEQVDETSDCDICGGVLNAPVPDRKPTGFRCYRCDQHFTRGERFVAHATRHVKLKAFACDDCGRSFTRRTRMLAHKARYHGTSDH